MCCCAEDPASLRQLVPSAKDDASPRQLGIVVNESNCFVQLSKAMLFMDNLLILMKNKLFLNVVNALAATKKPAILFNTVLLLDNLLFSLTDKLFWTTCYFNYDQAFLDNLLFLLLMTELF